jgi:competence protein ComEC
LIHREKLENNQGASLILDQVQMDRLSLDQTPKKIRITSRFPVSLPLGSQIKILVRLNPPSRPVSPFSFDFQRFYFFQSIGALGFALKEPELIRHYESKSNIFDAFFLDHVRQNIAQKIEDILPARLSGIATALMTGERAAIQDEDWQALRISGLAHIISISGLHVVLFAVPIFFFVRLFLISIPIFPSGWSAKKMAAFIALLGCSMYVFLVVPSVPTWRALLMTGVGLLAIMLDRSPFSMRLVAFSALVVLLFFPEAIWSASFQLSFGAVIGLVYFAEKSRNFWVAQGLDASFVRKILLYLAASIATSAVAFLCTSPLTAYHFQQIATYSIVANGLSIPITGLLIMPMIIVTFLLLPFGLEQLSISIMGLGIEWMLMIAHAVSAWPFAQIITSYLSFVGLCISVMGFLILCLCVSKIRFLGLAFMLLGLLILPFEKKAVAFVSESGKLLALQDPTSSGILVNSSRSDQFARTNWLKYWGFPEDSYSRAQREGSFSMGSITSFCDRQACLFEAPSFSIATGADLYELSQECSHVDFMMSEKKFSPINCKARVFDQNFLRQNGAVAIMDDKTIITVREKTGLRPWSNFYVPKEVAVDQ